MEFESESNKLNVQSMIPYQDEVLGGRESPGRLEARDGKSNTVQTSSLTVTPSGTAKSVTISGVPL